MDPVSYPLQEYLIEAEVQSDSKLIGNSIQANGLRDLGDLFLGRAGAWMTSC